MVNSIVLCYLGIVDGVERNVMSYVKESDF